MQQILKEARSLKEADLQFEPLGEWIHRFDFRKVDYDHVKPEVTNPNNYARNVLTMSPLEVAILYWPPGTESAIHHHEGFWGYVAVLEGEGANVEYRLKGKEFREQRIFKGLPGGIFSEPDGVTHKIANASKERPLLTAHFYYPAPESFDGMHIFDIEKRRIGVLNEKAETASWQEPDDHFHAIEEDAFTWKPYQAHSDKSHRIHPVIPKPDNDRIRRMITAYYEEQAREYDNFDLLHKSRTAYTRKVEELMGEDLRKNHKISHMLMLASGTGRRAQVIRELSGQGYQTTGVDMSREMCELAQKRGLKTINGEWVNVALPEDVQYDAAACLYAFGHIPDHSDRKKALQKLHTHLRPGAPFYLDVFNLNDKNEWGPQVRRFYENNRLQSAGYEWGDVFYQKTGGQEIAFLHYFTEDEIKALLEETGFQVEKVVHVGYVKKSGQILDQPDEGALFIKGMRN